MNQKKAVIEWGRLLLRPGGLIAMTIKDESGWADLRNVVESPDGDESEAESSKGDWEPHPTGCPPMGL